MKNKMYNHIVLCGLLSCSVALWGSQGNQPLTPRGTDTHNILQNVEKGVHNLEKKVHDAFTHDTTSGTPQTPDRKHRSRTSSHSSTASTSITPDPNHPAHHHHSLKQDFEKIEDKLHKGADKILGAVIANPQLVTEALTPVMGASGAQSATQVIELGATEGKKIVDDVDTLVKKAEAAQKTTQQPTTLIGKIETEGQKIEGLLEGTPQPNTQQPSKQLKITQGPNNKSGFTTYTILVGGAAIITTLAGIITLLHKYDYLPTNIGQFINKLISRNSAA